ncbi:putative ion transporter superfamily protein YfcC [Salsuginibacillus halophilus]|uniref:Putative ion transporter superfamily protein YfcC n=1 Tax=Salsuginibacillus halophilus TaxID=517424 RepID=A0A2P8HYS3_9BACI|nr:putative basic amino acid antiporter YfcC [Salsuginibacillus halophilus]PSL51369.1 putative ion transporter superfamily protein YfcC [Salsuginibacillus halophilus]
MGQNRRFQTPDTFVIIFFVVLAAAIMTYMIPQGQFEMEEVTYEHGDEEASEEVLDAEGYSQVTDDNGEPVRDGISLFEGGGGTGFLNYMFEGLVSGDKWGSAVGVVAFILIIGGAFGIIMRTGAVEEGIMKVIQRTQGRDLFLLPVIFFMFSLGGAVFGMGEEAIAFAMIIIPLVVALGYDAITGVMITYVATQIGFATSWMNPFGVAIAQGVADVPVLSGAPFRIFMWAFFTLVGIIYTVIYARRIKKDPTRSLSYETDGYFRENYTKENISSRFTLGHGLVVASLALGIVWIVWGVVAHAYYIPEIATQFFTIGLTAGVIGVVFKLRDMRINDVASSFKEGAQNLLPAALIVGMAKGIVIVLGGDDPGSPSVLNTILYHGGQLLDGVPSVVAAWSMFFFQSVFNFFVVSGSGQAALTMPLLAPLADLAEIPRQIAVLGYQLGDGFTNLIVPTSAALMGVLGVARIDWITWLKFQFKFQLLLFTLASLFIIAAVLLNFS